VKWSGGHSITKENRGKDETPQAKPEEAHLPAESELVQRNETN